MKKNFLSLFTLLVLAMCADASVMVCNVYPDENGHFDTPYIKSGTVTWDDASKTLTLDNAVIEYSSDNSSNQAIRITETATVVIQGECKVTNTGSVALSCEGYNGNEITIKGNGSLTTSSSWINIFLYSTHLTIQNIALNVAKGIGNNTEGRGVALAFDNVQAEIRGGVERIGDGITFKDCSITYPEDAYLRLTGYGYYIYCGNDRIPDYIIISRNSSVNGDVNGDGAVNIADLNVVINTILTGNMNMDCDVNGDNSINIADVNAVIGIILGGGAPAPNNHGYVDLGLPIRAVRISR